MAEPITLERRAGMVTAQTRFKRLGVQSFEPAWVSLWGFALRSPAKAPCAWLLASQTLRQPLLLTDAELAEQTQRPAADMALEGGKAPAFDAVSRQWFWERIANHKRWQVQLIQRPPTPLWLPCWLGYIKGRQHRLVVLSGLSGETLPQLKPAVLNGLKQAASK